MSLFAELRRRNVFRVGIAYGLIAWVLLQAADFGFDLVGAPNWLIQSLFVVALIGFPAALVFAWIYEMTPEGIKRERDVDRGGSLTPDTGRKLDRAIIVFLVLAVGGLLLERNWSEPSPDEVELASTSSETAPNSSPQATNDRQSVAVLPFLALSNGPDDEYFADGLTEEILNSLAHVPGLSVTSRTSAFHFKGQSLPTAEIASKLGVDHIVEGSVRRSGERLRVTAQLIRVADDAHLWSENYDSVSTDTITVQEDIALKIAEALNVYLDEATQQRMQVSGLRDVNAFIAYQKGVKLNIRGHGADNMLELLREGNDYFSEALAIAPDNVLGWLFSSDYNMHLLMDNAMGALDEPLDDAAWNTAFAGAENAFLQAARYARNPGARAGAELDLAFLRGDFAQWPRLFEQVLESDSCTAAIWAHIPGSALTFAQAYSTRVQELIDCDPYLANFWNHLIGIHIKLGDAEKALAIIADMPELEGQSFLYDRHVIALLITGKPDQARSVVDIFIESPVSRGLNLALIAAAAGDAESARNIAAELEASGQMHDMNRILLYARIGNRELANAAASRIDAMPLGYGVLNMVSYWCDCGAPFDAEAAPDFAARWAESGLDWPPPTPLPLPLKDW
jgi:TolB-like protein